MTAEYRICSRGVWDSTMPGITFDANGVSNYAVMFDELCRTYPRGEQGSQDWLRILRSIREAGRGKRYDCVIGVSGGTDSSYLLHLARRVFGLNPLAVTLDNGWSSDIAVKNIKRVTSKLGMDLETYVIDYEEARHVLRSYIKASLPWIDSATDIAIKACLYKVAKREGIKYTLNGGDFRTEGKQPTEWTYSDYRQMMYLLRTYEGVTRLESFPYYTITNLFRWGFLDGIKTFRPYYYIDYSKKEAQQLLTKEYGWEYYGGHHHENIFTRFAIAYWLPKKFNIDKRKITLSAQILSGEITRDEALESLKCPPYGDEDLDYNIEYVTKKLGITREQFEEYFHRPNKYFYDYPSYFKLYEKYAKVAHRLFSKILPFKPTIFIEQQYRRNNSDASVSQKESIV